MALFTYINSKFIYVERHIFGEMSKLYHDLLTYKCQLEQRIFKNSLIIATQAPEECAYDLMKGPGYMSIIAGEVVHMACSMANRTGSGLHVSDFLEILRIDKLT